MKRAGAVNGAGDVAGAVSTALVVGGGITGSMLALALAQRGVRTDLVEISPVWHGVGHGITVQGNGILSLTGTANTGSAANVRSIVGQSAFRSNIPRTRSVMKKSDRGSPISTRRLSV